MTLKEILTSQLKSTDDKEDWFAPLQVAIAGITAEQANWKPQGADHSIAELTTHLIFWNTEQLNKLNGSAAPSFSGDNKKTFSAVDAKEWPATVRKADSVMKALEKAIEAADPAAQTVWFDHIAHVSTHNAYHTGQIVLLRKWQGSWDPEKGVK